MNTTQQLQEILALGALPNNYILSIDSHNNEQFADYFANGGVCYTPWRIAEGREPFLLISDTGTIQELRRERETSLVLTVSLS